jgi:hypothetical protein
VLIYRVLFFFLEVVEVVLYLFFFTFSFSYNLYMLVWFFYNFMVIFVTVWDGIKIY